MNVYAGYAGGTFWNSDGSGSNYLCLHQEPEYDKLTPGRDGARAIVDSVEYEIYDFTPFGSQHNHDAPCAVCRVTLRGTMIMIPARMSCSTGWTREYFGYLMSARSNYKRTEFICFDRNPEAVVGSQYNEAGSAIFPVEVRCRDPDPDSFTGGLPCDKFPTGNELSCVVCTK